MLVFARGVSKDSAFILLAAGLVFTVLGAAGCRPNDLGTDCQLRIPVCMNDDRSECADPELAVIEYQTIEHEDFESDLIATGVVDCEHFLCVSSAGHESTPYCSRICTGDEHCRGGVQDLECRELLLDGQFLDGLREQLGEERYEEIFSGLERSEFCVVPRD